MMNSFAVRPLTRGLLALSLALASAVPLHAAEGTLLEGAGVKVTAADVREELDRLSPDVRQQILEEPEALRGVADRIYLRRAFAQRALQHGLENRPEVQSRLAMLREGVLADAEVARFMEALKPAPDVLEKQVRNAYRADTEHFNRPAETRASHILIKGTDAAAHAKAEDVLRQLKEGARFEDLARKVSADPGSASRGGSLGWFAEGRMVPQFDTAVNALREPGELSGIVQSPFGLHIIRLDDRRPAVVRTYEQVREELEADILEKLRQQERIRQNKALRDAARGDEGLLQAFIAAEKAKLTPVQTPAAQPAR